VGASARPHGFFYFPIYKRPGGRQGPSAFFSQPRLPQEKEKREEKMMKSYIGKVVRGIDLSEDEMMEAMNMMISGAASPAQAGALLTGLRVKGETVEEITGAVKALRANGSFIRSNGGTIAIDRDEINIEAETMLSTASGDDGSTRTFNVSAATAFVAAGAGLKVVRYGTRVTSRLCGSADVLEQLGINLHLQAGDIQRCLDETGMAFFYPPVSSGPMGKIAQVRQEIGIRTLLNLVGPLCNPADAAIQMVGVYRPELTEKTALSLKRLGTKAAMAVHGEGALDEISICGRSTISRLSGGEISSFDLTPEEVGLKRASIEDVAGGNAGKNASIIKDVLEGTRGPRRDMVLLNSAACFVAAGLDISFEEGIKRAEDSIDSGSAGKKLAQLVSFTGDTGPYVRKEFI